MPDINNDCWASLHCGINVLPPLGVNPTIHSTSSNFTEFPNIQFKQKKELPIRFHKSYPIREQYINAQLELILDKLRLYIGGTIIDQNDFTINFFIRDIKKTLNNKHIAIEYSVLRTKYQFCTILIKFVQLDDGSKNIIFHRTSSNSDNESIPSKLEKTIANYLREEGVIE